jgi:hypothetical protein
MIADWRQSFSARRWIAAVLAGLCITCARGQDEDIAAITAVLSANDVAAIRDVLSAISARTSPDHAAEAFATAIERIPRNRIFRERFDAALRRDWTPADFALVRDRYLFLFVPGWFYRREPTTGADLAQPRAVLTSLGFATRLVEIDENGTIEANAAALADEISVLNGSDSRRIVIASTSKGGPEVLLALDRLRRAGRADSVAAWVNIGGLLNGTAIADRWMQWPRRWLAAFGFAFMGHGTSSIASMTTTARRAKFAEAELPNGLLVVNYLAVPRALDISSHARERYQTLAPHGPNDGLTLLGDAIVPTGYTLLERGLDHFFAAADLDRRIVALTRVVLAQLEQE